MKMRWATLALLVLVLDAGQPSGLAAGDKSMAPVAQASDSITPVWVGPGSTDVSTHQVVRTSRGRSYIFASEMGRRTVHAYRAANEGVPASFAEADADHRPRGSGDISTVDAAIDGNDVVHLVWHDLDGPVSYQTFDTRTDAWAPPTRLAEGGVWPGPGGGSQACEALALALDSSGAPHVVYTGIENGLRGLWYRNMAGGSWSRELRVDDVPGFNNGHPALAFDGADRLSLAWLVEQTGASTGEIRLRSRTADGSWEPSSTLVDGGRSVYSDSFLAIDQGPSLLVTRDGKRHLAYIASWEPSPGCPSDPYQYGGIRYRYEDEGGWVTLAPTENSFTHNPSLASNEAGDLYLFGHDDACLHPTAASMYYYQRKAGEDWGGRTLLATGPYDSSVSVKWAWNFWNEPALVEIVFWTQDEPYQLYYVAVPSS